MLWLAVTPGRLQEQHKEAFGRKAHGWPKSIINPQKFRLHYFAYKAEGKVSI